MCQHFRHRLFAAKSNLKSRQQGCVNTSLGPTDCICFPETQCLFVFKDLFQKRMERFIISASLFPSIVLYCIVGCFHFLAFAFVHINFNSKATKEKSSDFIILFNDICSYRKCGF